MPPFALELVHVPATGNQPFQFGPAGRSHPVRLRAFWIARFPTTQQLWTTVLGTNPARHQGDQLPIETVTWDQIVQPGGFLDQLNTLPEARALAVAVTGRTDARFRLPSETEWEYAAMGGPRWTEQLPYAGHPDIATVAWYQGNSDDHTHPVGQKAPNQLALYDMSGNVWEWCQDTFVRDPAALPVDGRPFLGAGADRSLRGGCFHNAPIHCTPTWRYEIDHQYGDPCIGFRVVLAPVAA